MMNMMDQCTTWYMWWQCTVKSRQMQTHRPLMSVFGNMCNKLSEWTKFTCECFHVAHSLHPVENQSEGSDRPLVFRGCQWPVPCVLAALHDHISPLSEHQVGGGAPHWCLCPQEVHKPTLQVHQIQKTFSRLQTEAGAVLFLTTGHM